MALGWPELTARLEPLLIHACSGRSGSLQQAPFRAPDWAKDVERFYSPQSSEFGDDEAVKGAFYAQVVDYVNYTAGLDHSYGSFPDGQPFIERRQRDEF